MNIIDIVNKWYSEYINATFLTEHEYKELIELCDIITQRSGLIENWTNEQLKKYLPIIIPSGTITSQLHEFRNRELSGKQGTDEWLNARNNYITASISASCAGIMGSIARENQLLEKASFGKYRPFKGGYYTEKGNMFEDVTNAYYSHVNNTKIWAFNLIPHNNPIYSFLAASTDGVSDRLINIEIKTLVGRAIDNTKFKKEYIHQMQHQMECLNLKETDFIEVKYQEYDSLELAMCNCPDISRVGTIIELWDERCKKLCYEYAPIGLKFSDLRQWEENKTTYLRKSNYLLYIRSIYWNMTDYLCRRVKKDPHWLTDMGPRLKMFWDEVLELRANPKKLQQRINDRKRKSRYNNEPQLGCLL